MLVLVGVVAEFVRGRFFGDGVRVAVAALIGDDQLGQKADRHQLSAQQQSADGIDQRGRWCSGFSSRPGFICPTSQ